MVAIKAVTRFRDFLSRDCETFAPTYELEGGAPPGYAFAINNWMRIGKKHWAIAEGWIPAWSHGPEPEMLSHETACMLNPNDTDAHVEITIYYSNRDPAGPYKLTVPARRTLHQRFNDLKDPEPIPKATTYASTIFSDVPIVVQHTRLDSRQNENALVTTIAFSGNE